MLKINNVTQILKIPKLEYEGFSDEEFFDFCMANEGLSFERNSKREIIIMPPTGGDGGSRELDLAFVLKMWSIQHGGGYTFSSSTAFTLPNSAIRSPDFTWIKSDRWLALPESERKKFAKITPDFVVELMSESDSWKGLQLKMIEYMENGVQLGWLINPFEQKYMIYTPEKTNPEEQEFGIITGGDLLKDLAIDLRTVFQL